MNDRISNDFKIMSLRSEKTALPEISMEKKKTMLVCSRENRKDSLATDAVIFL